MKRTTLFILTLVLAHCISLSRVQGQVADYVFSGSTSEYRQLADGTTHIGSDECLQDAALDAIALPFDFTYCNTVYTSIGVNENGWIRFGTTDSAYVPHILNDQTGIVAGFAQDLLGCGTDHRLSTATVGSVPNRVFIVQWDNWGFSPAGVAEFSFQIALFETTHQIEVRYGDFTGATVSDVTVGLSGVLPDDTQIRETNTDWFNTVAGSDSSVCVYSATVKPFSGLTFRWSPADSAANMAFTVIADVYKSLEIADVVSLTPLAGCYDDQVFPAITLPFDFMYDNDTVNTLGVHANGYIKMNGIASTYFTNVLASQTNTLSVMHNDLYGCATNRAISYAVTGTSPEREFVIEWNDWGFYVSGLNEFSCQVRLRESDNSIQFIYGDCYGLSNKTVTVGINGDVLSDFHLRRVNTNWSFSAKAISNTAVCAFNPSVIPGSGLTYTFTPPPSCSGTPFAGAAEADTTSVCAGSTVSLGLAGAEAGPDISYQWQISAEPDTEFVDVSGMIDSVMSINVENSAYFRCVVTCSLSGLFGYSEPVFVEAIALPEAYILHDSITAGCQGESFTLELITDSLHTVQWYDQSGILAGAESETYVASASGWYFAMVSNGACQIQTAPVQVSIYPAPEWVAVDASIDSVCAGTAVELSAISPPAYIELLNESWDAEEFAATGWSIGDTLGNWTGWTGVTPDGSAPPTAYFSWTPLQIDYTSSLISPVIDATAYEQVYLSYRLRLDNYSTATVEQFKVEYKSTDSTEWQLLELFSNSGIADDTTYVRDAQLLSVGGSWIQLRFTAFGENSFNIDGWGIDDIVVTGSAAYQYTWSSDPAGYTAEGQVVELIEPVAGAYWYYATVTQTETGCSATTDSVLVYFTTSDTYYADTDSDGFGNAIDTVQACGLPPGYVLNDQDCNDTTNTVYPGNPEICDGLDNDCDGFIDNFIVATVTPAGPITICNGTPVILSASTGPGYMYQWKKNGANIGGATNANYSATKAGNYSVLISVTGGCSALSNSVSVSVNPSPGATITNTDGTNNLCIDPSIKLKANNGAGFTWQWIKNGSNIAGATNITYSATTTGNYRVLVTNALGCSKTSAAVNLIYACREEEGMATGALEVYPNPTGGTCTIVWSTLGDPDTDVAMEVISVQGQRVGEILVPVANGYGELQWSFPEACASGMYLIRITSAGSSSTRWIELVR